MTIHHRRLRSSPDSLYGYRPAEVNRNALCARGGYSHRVCWRSCLARTEENIGAMYAEYEEPDSEEVGEAVNEDTSFDSNRV